MGISLISESGNRCTRNLVQMKLELRGIALVLSRVLYRRLGPFPEHAILSLLETPFNFEFEICEGASERPHKISHLTDRHAARRELNPPMHPDQPSFVWRRLR